MIATKSEATKSEAMEEINAITKDIQRLHEDNSVTARRIKDLKGVGGLLSRSMTSLERERLAHKIGYELRQTLTTGRISQLQLQLQVKEESYLLKRHGGRCPR
jgi:hypothetical protein